MSNHLHAATYDSINGTLIIANHQIQRWFDGYRVYTMKNKLVGEAASMEAAILCAITNGSK